MYLRPCVHARNVNGNTTEKEGKSKACHNQAQGVSDANDKHVHATCSACERILYGIMHCAKNAK